MEQEIAQVIKQTAYLLCKSLSVEIKKTIYEEWIKGDAKAGALIGVSSEAMKSRRARGFYREGYHFKKKSDRIVLWSRDALLEEWSVQNGQAMFTKM